MLGRLCVVLVYLSGAVGTFAFCLISEPHRGHDQPVVGWPHCLREASIWPAHWIRYHVDGAMAEAPDRHA